jgi:hypothetical protein
MCGIAGYADHVQAPDASPEHLADSGAMVGRMCGVIRHRGPDDEGVHVAPGVGLGMRRLSIIDLATGHQPIRNEDGTVWVVFNGEIYNYRELGQELRARGHRFYTTTDTEVIVHAYEEWGEGAFIRLRGMFGIALWDAARRVLWLARDRVGIKPLYYTTRGERFYFGSELKSLLAADAVTRTVDPVSLEHYLAFLYTPPDRAIFPGVHKLPPGHLLELRDGRVRVAPYWTPPADEQPVADENRGGGPTPRAPARRRALAPRERRAARGVSLGRHRFEPRRGADGRGLGGTGADVLDRLRRAGVRRARRRPARGAALRHRAPRVRRPARRPAHRRAAGVALRRAVRRLVRDPDVVRLGARAPARHRGAVG